MDAPICLLDLPMLCIDAIVQSIFVTATERERAKCAAAMCIASSTSHDLFGSRLYNLIDPGCVDVLDAARRKREDDIIDMRQELASEPLTVLPNIDRDSKLVDLKAACKTICCSSTGSEAKLWESILEHVATKLRHRQLLHNAITEVTSTIAPISRLKCPVRHFVRTLCSALASPMTNIAATTATEMGANYTILSNIKCELRRNPHYRRAPPMRLYNRVAVIRAIIAIISPRPLVIDDVRHCVDSKVDIAIRQDNADALDEGGGRSDGGSGGVWQRKHDD